MAFYNTLVPLAQSTLGAAGVEHLKRTTMTLQSCDGSALLAAFFEMLNAHAVPYCVMGNTEFLPQTQGNDIDIICAPDALAAAQNVIFAFAGEHGGVVAQLLRHESKAFYHVLYLPRTQGRLYFKFDVCADYVIDGRLLLSAGWLLEERRRIGNEPFFTAAPTRAFAYYLLKKIAKGYADDAALKYLGDLMTSDREGCRAILRQYWPERLARVLEDAIRAGRWVDIAPILSALRRALDQHLPAPSLGLWLAEWARRADRVVRPTGFVVAVLGPDGAGKGTLLDNLMPNVAPLARKQFRFHLAPPLARRTLSGAAVDDPHALQPRSAFMSTLKLIYFVAAYNLGWLRSVWLQRRQSGMIFFDRYYHDLLADPRRYRNGAPRWLVRVVGHLIPTPDLFVILDVKPGIARARKSEVSEDESKRQFEAYRALTHELPRAVLIDANSPPQDVADACERTIVEAMAARLRRRAVNVAA